LIEEFRSLSIKQIAEKYNCKEETVYRKITEILSSKENLTSQHHEKIKQLKAYIGEGKTWRQIAKLMGLSPASVLEFARNHKLVDLGDKPAFQIGLPIGCPDCVMHPHAMSLCINCYARLRYRRKVGLIKLDKSVTLIQSDTWKVICYVNTGKFEIYQDFMGFPSRHDPTPLEIFLLKQIYRRYLIDLDYKALLKDYDALVAHENQNEPT
jgi:DNA-binding CsgD family transcriptional regulator